MPVFEITAPDGKKYRVEGPPGSTKEQALAQVQARLSSPQPASAQPVAPSPQQSGGPSFSQSLASQLDQSPMVGLSEAGGNVISNIAAFPVQAAGSIYGMLTAPYGHKMEQARNNINAVTDAMVYQPRSTSGQMLSKGAGFVLSIPGMIGDAAGTGVTKAAESFGAGPNVATGIGAATDVGIQAIPVLLGAKYSSAKAARAKAARAAGAGVESTVQGATPEARAQSYVEQRTGLDWNNLSDSFRSKLSQIAEDSKNLESLDPAAVERQGRLESLGIRGTRGQITRNSAQLRNEGNVSATEAGAELRKLYAEQNQKIVGALNDVKAGTGGVADTAEQVGRSVQDTALRAKAAASKANYDRLYAKARATEPGAAVASDPLYDFLDSNPEVQHTGWLGSWLKKAKVESKVSQDGIEVTQRRPVTLAELQDLRTKANSIARTGGTDGYYAGEVVRAIDAAMEDAPNAAKAWREANAAYRAHKMEFSEQGAVAQLVENSSKTDRAVALENTWRKTVIGGSIEDLVKVRNSLTTGSDPKIVGAGKQAWRDLGAQTVQHIIDEATKSVTRMEDGTPNVTPAAMERAIKSVGYDKLKILFGPEVVAKIRTIMEATRDLKTEPPTGFKGSATFANIITMLEKSAGRLPGVGSVVTGAVRAAAKLKDIGESGRQVRNALADPMAESATNAVAQSNSFTRRNALMKYGTAAGVAGVENRR